MNHFQISKCIQNRLHRTPLSSPASRYSNLISGFLCGSVFWLNPDVTLLCHGLSAAIQLTFQNYFLNWLTSKSKSITNCAANFPWSKVVFMIATGYVMHLVILYPSLCSKFMHKMSDTIVSRRQKNTLIVYTQRGHSQLKLLYQERLVVLQILKCTTRRDTTSGP